MIKKMSLFSFEIEVVAYFLSQMKKQNQELTNIQKKTFYFEETKQVPEYIFALSESTDYQKGLKLLGKYGNKLSIYEKTPEQSLIAQNDFKSMVCSNPVYKSFLVIMGLLSILALILCAYFTSLQDVLTETFYLSFAFVLLLTLLILYIFLKGLIYLFKQNMKLHVSHLCLIAVYLFDLLLSILLIDYIGFLAIILIPLPIIHFLKYKNDFIWKIK